jgi:serine/threonine protein kinase
MLTQEELSKVHDEIEINKLIDHPNIVKVNAVYEDDKSIYIVMELLKGGEVSPCLLALNSVLVSFLTI